MKPSSTRSPTGTATNTSRQYLPVATAALTLGDSSTERTRCSITVARSGTPSAAACAAASAVGAVARGEVDRLQHRVHRAADRGAGAASAPRRLVVDSLVGFGPLVPSAHLVAGRESSASASSSPSTSAPTAAVARCWMPSRRDRRRTAQARERGLAPLAPRRHARRARRRRSSARSIATRVASAGAQRLRAWAPAGNAVRSRAPGCRCSEPAGTGSAPAGRAPASSRRRRGGRARP